jgi:hypothetical protein
LEIPPDQKASQTLSTWLLMDPVIMGVMVRQRRSVSQEGCCRFLQRPTMEV